MKKFLAIAISLVLVVFSGWLSVQYIHEARALAETTRALEEARMRMVTAIYAINRQADTTLVTKWREVAGDYVDDYQLGRLDEMFTMTNRANQQFAEFSRNGFLSYRDLAAVTSKYVRDAVHQRMVDAHDEPITYDRVDLKFQADERVRRLLALSAAKGQLDLQTQRIIYAATMVELLAAEKNSEPKKEELIHCIKAVEAPTPSL